MSKQAQLYLFPFAGGNAYSYRPMLPMLQNSFEVITPELPGRGTLAASLPISELHQLVEYLFNSEIRGRDSTRPYVMFGHSMGAMIIYLLAHKISQSGLRMPSHIVMSGRNAPAVERTNPISHQPSDVFWDSLKKLGGVPKALLEHTELKAYFEPIIRNDFGLVERYKYHLPETPLDVPMTVIYGTQERMNRERWQHESSRPIKFIEMEGDHFFILNHWASLADYLRSLV